MQLMFILYRPPVWSWVRQQTLGAARISFAARPHHPYLVVPTNLLSLSLCRWDFGEVRRMLYCLMPQERGNSSRPHQVLLVWQPAAPTACRHQDLLEQSLPPASGEAQDVAGMRDLCQIILHPCCPCLDSQLSGNPCSETFLDLLCPWPSHSAKAPWGLSADLQTRAVPADGILYADTSYSVMWALERLSLTFLGVRNWLPRFNSIKFLWRHRKFQPVKHSQCKKPSAFIVHRRLLI